MIMKKKVLALSVAAALGGVVGSANAALSIREAGIGHALILPYFTTQNGNATLINIVNTDPTYGKAVKVRFRSGVDSDDIADFQVFLSPNDVWTANVSQNASGLSVLTTSDKSCTLPASTDAGFGAFATTRLTSYTDSAGVVHSVNEQTREGYVEIFNMADIPATTALAAVGAMAGRLDNFSASTTANPLYTATKHVAGVAPCTNATLLNIEANGVALGEVVTAPAIGGVGGATYVAGQQVIAPTTGLMGNWTIINVPATRVYSGNMAAIQASTQTNVIYSGQISVARSATHTVAGAGVIYPTLRQTEDGVLLNSSQTGVRTADYDFPDMSTPFELGAATHPRAHANQLSNAFLRASVLNEFLTDTSISAGTDWVLSLPTRRYHVAGRGAAYGTNGDTNGYPTAESADDGYSAGGVTAPFVAGNVTFASNGRSSCIATGAAPGYFNREEVASTGSGAVMSPGVPTTYSLCGEVNVLSWNNSGSTSSVLGATLILANSSAGTTRDGWAVAAMGGGGLPVLGSAFMKAYNPAVSAGVSGNFGAAYDHRYK
jgi:hypothetical protein